MPLLHPYESESLQRFITFLEKKVPGGQDLRCFSYLLFLYKHSITTSIELVS